MSASSLSPARHRKTSSSSSKKGCDFGDQHVERAKYEDLKLSYQHWKEKAQEKDAELLGYHNDLADLSAQTEKLKVDLGNEKIARDKAEKEG